MRKARAYIDGERIRHPSIGIRIDVLEDQLKFFSQQGTDKVGTIIGIVDSLVLAISAFYIKSPKSDIVSDDAVKLFLLSFAFVMLVFLIVKLVSCYKGSHGTVKKCMEVIKQKSHVLPHLENSTVSSKSKFSG